MRQQTRPDRWPPDLGRVDCVNTPAAEPFPGTQALTATGDFASNMVDGIDRFLLRQIDLAQAQRTAAWHPDFSSPEAYERSLAGKRERLRKILGVVDARLPFNALEYVSTTHAPGPLVGKSVSKGDDWDLRRPLAGIAGRGRRRPAAGTHSRVRSKADCIVVPDCEMLPEALAGMTDDLPKESQIARKLAEQRIRVLIPVLSSIGRSDYPVLPGKGPTGQPHREWIYRQAYEMGRHILGYEVQKNPRGGHENGSKRSKSWNDLRDCRKASDVGR